MEDDPFLDAIATGLKEIPRMVDGDYFDPNDGLLYCGKCNTRKQKRIHLPANSLREEFNKVIPIYCKCFMDKFAEEKKELEEQQRRDRIIALKRKCFDSDDAALADMVFEKDDKKNLELTKQMYKYARAFKDVFLPKSLGLLLWGNAGTGKTFYAACIANYLVNQDIPVRMTSITKICNELQNWNGIDRQDYIDGLQRYALLILDDLGTERSSEYVREITYNVINERYLSKLPLILTTNMSDQEIKFPSVTSCERIYDRILQMCHIINVKGNSRRRDQYAQRHDAVDHYLKE